MNFQFYNLPNEHMKNIQTKWKSAFPWCSMYVKDSIFFLSGFLPWIVLADCKMLYSVSLYSAWHYFSGIVGNIKKRTFKLSFKIHNRKRTNTDIYNVKQDIKSFVWDLKSYKNAEAKAELCPKSFGTISKSFKWFL